MIAQNCPAEVRSIVVFCFLLLNKVSESSDKDAFLTGGPTAGCVAFANRTG
jgi:hypothetical protein